MGGTSTDVRCGMRGMRLTSGSIVAGLPVAVPTVDIQQSGGGRRIDRPHDDGGSLRVGPESAGAEPAGVLRPLITPK